MAERHDFKTTTNYRLLIVVAINCGLLSHVRCLVEATQLFMLFDSSVYLALGPFVFFDQRFSTSFLNYRLLA